ncbi:MAG: hypothetical protein WBF53_15120 [Litorimonas sp.]
MRRRCAAVSIATGFGSTRVPTRTVLVLPDTIRLDMRPAEPFTPLIEIALETGAPTCDWNSHTPGAVGAALT